MVAYIDVCVAGMVGQWWRTPYDSYDFISHALLSSLKRALTTSLGSVCYGSLLVNYFNGLRWLLRDTYEYKEYCMCMYATVSLLFGCIRDFVIYMVRNHLLFRL